MFFLILKNVFTFLAISTPSGDILSKMERGNIYMIELTKQNTAPFSVMIKPRQKFAYTHQKIRHQLN